MSTPTSCKTRHDQPRGNNGRWKRKNPKSKKPRYKRTFQACISCHRRHVKCDLGSFDNPSGPPCRCCRTESIECDLPTTQRRKVVRDQDAELRSELDSLRHQNAEQRTELDSLRQQNTELDSLRHQNTEQQTELDSLRHQNTEQQTELDSLLHQNAEQQTEPDSLLHQNAEQQTELEALKAHRSTNDSQATETQCQINETPYPFDLPLSFGLGINTQCDQWPNTNVTFGSAPLLPFPASDPFMSRGAVWNDVEHLTFDFTCKPPQLSDPDPALNFIPEVVLDDWYLQTYPRDCTTLVPMSYSTFGNAELSPPITSATSI